MANAIINVGSTGGQINISTAAAPATPAVGVVTLYAGTDKALHVKNSDGTDITIAAGMTGPTGPQGQTGATGPAGSNATSPITVQQTCSLVSTAIGATAASGVNCAVSIGNNAQLFAGATGTIVLGSLSNGGTGACNSVVIGNSSQTTGACSVTIGFNVSNPANCTIHIPVGSSTVCNTNNIPGGVSIGNGGGSILSLQTGGSEFVGTMIGSWNSRMCGSGGSILLGGLNNTVTGISGNIAIGSQDSCVTAQYNAFVINTYASCNTCSRWSGVLGGFYNVMTSTGAANIIVGGNSHTIGSNYANSVIIGGSCITADASNTVYTPNLKVTGQAASLTNAVGSTGGSVTLDWDNSNIQTLTLTSNITTLTKSNPIDGAVYTLFLTQGGTGGKTVSWGADVDWPSGTAPTLSTAAGATDAVSLIYIAGVTGYYGNANLNFS